MSTALSDPNESCVSKPAEDLSCVMCAAGKPARKHQAREMMYGTRAQFTYIECAGCHSVQIAAPPPDLASYYPADYYSYDTTKVAPLKRLRQRIRHNLVLFAPAPIATWAEGSKGDKTMPLLRRAGVKRGSSDGDQCAFLLRKH